jgi:hypothetical protein
MILDQPNVYKADVREMIRKAKTKGSKTRILNQEIRDIQDGIDCLQDQFDTDKTYKVFAYYLGNKFTRADIETFKLYLVAIEELRSELPVNTIKETV